MCNSDHNTIKKSEPESDETLKTVLPKSWKNEIVHAREIVKRVSPSLRFQTKYPKTELAKSRHNRERCDLRLMEASMRAGIEDGGGLKEKNLAQKSKSEKCVVN